MLREKRRNARGAGIALFRSHLILGVVRPWRSGQLVLALAAGNTSHGRAPSIMAALVSLRHILPFYRAA